MILLLFIRTVGDIHWNLFTFKISQKCVAQIRTLHSINLIFCCRKMHFSTVIEVALCAEDSFFRLNFPSSENGTLINFSTLFDGTKFNYCQFVGMFLIKKKTKNQWNRIENEALLWPLKIKIYHRQSNKLSLPSVPPIIYEHAHLDYHCCYYLTVNKQKWKRNGSWIIQNN